MWVRTRSGGYEDVVRGRSGLIISAVHGVVCVLVGHFVFFAWNVDELYFWKCFHDEEAHFFMFFL